MSCGSSDLNSQTYGVTAGACCAKAELVDVVTQLVFQSCKERIRIGVGPVTGADCFTASLGCDIHLSADTDTDTKRRAWLAACVDGGFQNETF